MTCSFSEVEDIISELPLDRNRSTGDPTGAVGNFGFTRESGEGLPADPHAHASRHGTARRCERAYARLFVPYMYL